MRTKALMTTKTSRTEAASVDVKTSASRQALLIGTGTWPGEGRPRALRSSPPLYQDRTRVDLR
ncbi:hypothetical protein PLICRDRAFT_181193 [Plicaturopsis crispa FD-325 SS-3]|uniref:Uncharacterized protein n=1 Tax=Plicaturopsis crispa FD-325 SS-3 TaxID=944288 RepID=A0A0C9T0N0_PLICR|nr:hypothetical protein PLICRDRAFT_181193 [Plicaturopsis crispa FD-325 SS-3]